MVPLGVVSSNDGVWLDKGVGVVSEDVALLEEGGLSLRVLPDRRELEERWRAAEGKDNTQP